MMKATLPPLVFNELLDGVFVGGRTLSIAFSPTGHL